MNNASDVREDISRLSQKLDTLEGIASDLEFDEIRDSIGDSRSRLANEQFIVTVLGEFSRGKSTLINAFLRTPLLPTGVTPTTATLNIVHHNSENEILVHREGDEPLDITSRSEDLEKYVADSDVDVSTLKYIEIGYPVDCLRDGTVIVDTPGINDIDEERIEVTYGYVPVSDAVIIVLDAKSPLRATEMAFIRDHVLTNDIGKLFLVMNRTDELEGPGEVEDVLAYVEQTLDAMDLAGRPKAYALSARMALNAFVEEDGPSIEESGWMLFEEDLKDFILGVEKNRARIEKYRGRLQKHCAAIIDSIDTWIYTGSQDIETLKTEQDRLRRRKPQLQDNFGKLLEYVDRQVGYLNRNIYLSLSKRRQKVVEDLCYRLRMHRAPMEEFVKSTAPYIIRKAIMSWYEQNEKNIAKLVNTIHSKAVTGFERNFGKKPIMRSISEDYSSWIGSGELQTELDADDEEASSIRKAYSIGGAVTGGVLALAIGLPAISLISMPLIGGNLAARLGSKQAARKQEEQKERIEGQLPGEVKRICDAIHHRIGGNVEDVMDRFKRRLREEFEKTLSGLEEDIGESIKAYSGDIEEQQQRIARLRQARKSVESLGGEE